MGSAEELKNTGSGASLEGLEQVFEPTAHTSEVNSQAASTSSEATNHSFGSPTEGSEVQDTKAIEIVTTEEAAKRLGISARAVLNRIKAGSLQGKKIRGRFKDEWRVLWSLDTASTEASEVYSEVTSEPVSDEDQTSADRDSPGAEELLFVSEQVRALTEQTQALSYRNGYLEAQLEASRSQLKLLPDFQSKATENEVLKSRIEELERQLTETRRPWWKRVFG